MRLPPFVRAEAVANDDTFAAAAVQRPDQRAADKARAAGDEHLRIGKVIRLHISPVEHGEHDANQSGIQVNAVFAVGGAGLPVGRNFDAARQICF